MFFLEKSSTILHIDMVPRQLVVELVILVQLSIQINAGVRECLPPPFRIELFGPAIKSSASPPSQFDGFSGAAIASAQQACIDVMAFDVHAA